MFRQRVRLRFRKEGDLRLTSHRDIARVFERMFRRADVRLSMSEGFHPKARMNFPMPLSLGIAGLDEVMEFDLAEEIPDEELLDRLQRQTTTGLSIDHLEQIEATRKNKARVVRVNYQLAVPKELLEPTRQKMGQIETQTTFTVQRSGGKRPVDLLEFLDHWEIIDGALQFRLKVESQAGVHPREVLDALELTDIEQHGVFLTRTEVCIADDPQPPESIGRKHEKRNVD